MPQSTQSSPARMNFICFFLLLLMLFCCFPYCSSTLNTLRLLDLPPSEHAHAIIQAREALESAQYDQERIVAIKLLGLFVTGDRGLTETIAVYYKPISRNEAGSNITDLNYWIIWAMGQIQTPEAIQHLLTWINQTTSMSHLKCILVSLYKLQPLILEQKDWIIAVIEQLNMLHARKDLSPELYTLSNVLYLSLNDLNIRVEVFRRAVEQFQQTPNPSTVESVYHTLLECFDYIQLHHARLEKGNTNRILLEKSLTMLLMLLKENDVALNRMVVWYLGRIADLEPVQVAIKEGVIPLLHAEDPQTRLLAIYALIRIQLTTAGVKRTIIEEVLAVEQYEAIIEFLSTISKDKQDAIQKIFNLG